MDLAGGFTPRYIEVMLYESQYTKQSIISFAETEGKIIAQKTKTYHWETIRRALSKNNQTQHVDYANKNPN